MLKVRFKSSVSSGRQEVGSALASVELVCQPHLCPVRRVDVSGALEPAANATEPAGHHLQMCASRGDTQRNADIYCRLICQPDLASWTSAHSSIPVSMPHHPCRTFWWRWRNQDELVLSWRRRRVIDIVTVELTSQ